MRPPIGMPTLVVALALLWTLLTTGPSWAGDVFAPTCSEDDVKATAEAAPDESYVWVPAGQCTWTKGVVLALTQKKLALGGMGADTVIEDRVPGRGISAAIPGGGEFRLHNMMIKAFKTGLSTQINSQFLFLYGSGPGAIARVDHLLLPGYPDAGVRLLFGKTDKLIGVVDHTDNLGTGKFGQMFHVDHGGWKGVGSYGDKSWAEPCVLGSGDFMFFEDNVWINNGVAQAAIDSLNGGRYVARNNLVQSLTFGGHGTDSGQRMRSVMCKEIYRNTFRRAPGQTLWALGTFRGGSGLVWGNVLESDANPPAGGWGLLWTYRATDPATPWGQCNGLGPWDHNDAAGGPNGNGIYFAGTASGGALDSLLDTTQAWTSGQCSRDRYILHNLTRKWASAIISNTATELKTQAGVVVKHTTVAGDKYEVRRVIDCIDSPAMGHGVLLAGNPPAPSGWPQQVKVPVRIWGNTGKAPAALVIRQPSGGWYRPGVDYCASVDDSCKPEGYVPYEYPHRATKIGFLAGPTTTPPPPPPVNQPPTVTAGADIQLTLPAAAALVGQATDDGLPAGSALILTWSAVSGPGPVAFSSAGTGATEASFGAPGTYVLRLRASDGELATEDEVTVTVAAAPLPPADTAAPAIASIAVVGKWPQRSARVAVTDDVGTDKVVVLINGGIALETTAGAVTWTADVPIPAAKSVVVSVHAADAAGNWSSAKRTINRP